MFFFKTIININKCKLYWPPSHLCPEVAPPRTVQREFSVGQR